MSPKTKNEYTKALLRRYKTASKKQKSIILNEFCLTTGYHRKYAIEKLNATQKPGPKPKHPGPSSPYKKPELIAVLKRIWISGKYPCSKRLKSMLPLWLNYCQTSEKIKTLLIKISPATIDRILKPIRSRYTQKGLCATKPGSLLKNSIAVKLNQWNEQIPGFFEADTVHHCESSLSGQYIVSLTMTDIATGWTECRASFGLGHTGIVNQIKNIEQQLPFQLRGFDSDCGKEFMNHTLLDYLTHRTDPVEFTRSRAYHKNDNAHVEQKNWTHVRQWLGYKRFENPKITNLLNELYANEFSLLHNFYFSSMKLITKKRIKSKTIKIHDTSKTPYQRILESHHIDQKTKEFLTLKFKTLDPFKLRQTIDRKLKKILRLASPP